MNKKWILFPVTLLLICLTGCSNTKNDESIELRVGYLPIAAGLPLFIAQEEGYFKDAGFQVTLENFASSDLVTTAATEGKIDIFIAASNVIFDQGFQTQKKHKLIYANPYSKRQGHIADYLLSKDLTKISKIQDLKGKTIGVFPGSVSLVFLNEILRKYGIQPNEYTLKQMVPSQWIAALQSGQVDALSAIEPVASEIIQNQIAQPIVSGFFAELMPEVPLSAQWISYDFSKKNNSQTLTKLIQVMNRVVDFVQTNPDLAKKHLQKYVPVSNSVLPHVQLNYWTKHENIQPNVFQSFIDLLHSHNELLNKENINDYLLK